MELLAHNGERYTINKSLQAKAARYESFVDSVRELMQSDDPGDQALVARAKDAMRTKFLTPGQVHVDSTLSNVSIQYANEAFIGLELMPEVQVAKQSNTYFKYDKRNRLAYPDDAMNARSKANEINETRSTDTYACRPYALSNYLDADTEANQDAPLDEMVDLVQSVAEGVAFRREQRIATIATTAGNFGGNTTALTGANKWVSGGGNPIKNIQDARAALWSGRGPTRIVAAMDLFTWNELSRHPAMLDLFKYGGSTPGLMKPEMFATYFRVDDVLIAEGRADTANEGQTASYGRIWPNFFGLYRVAKSPSIRSAAFGFTFRNGPVRTDEWYDQSLGIAGGYYARVSTKEDHKVVAPDTAYLIATPI